MLISSSIGIDGRRILHSIGKIEAASAWHAANSAPQQENWREFILQELIRKAEDIDADAIICFDCKADNVTLLSETGVPLKRNLATGVAVKLSCAA
jgi:uncharacterized protein YbjQ (UPF0145 family)